MATASTRRRARWWLALLLLPAFAAGTLFGVLSLYWKLPPLYPALLRANALLAAGSARFLDPSEPVADRDGPEEPFVAELISVDTAADVAALRRALTAHLWGEDAVAGRPPGRPPASVETDVADARFADLDAVAGIDRLTFAMDFGFESIVYRFRPASPGRGVVLFHQGHRPEGFAGSADLIDELLGAGHTVFALSMPLTGDNPRPEVELPRHGPLRITTHNQMELLRPETGHPIRYFIQPVIDVLDHAESTLPGEDLFMVGLSGGGWTTTMAAALDPRIRASYPVAGSLPFFLMSGALDGWGEFEQFDSRTYEVANYLELYVLAASGAGREHVPIYNEFDPCCYFGTGMWRFDDTVRARVEAIGEGGFEVLIDRTHREHAISAFALGRILERIARHAPPAG